MTPIRVIGLGAVSPAGWGVAALRDAVARGAPLPVQSWDHPGGSRPLPVRLVPPPVPPPGVFAHPRLRRASPLSRYGLAAAVEALGGEMAARAAGAAGLGIIVCVTAGGVNYTRRFYAETLHDPTSASPVVFPETVFNAPASHMAAWLGSTGESCTWVGDEGMFLQGLALAAEWLIHRRADAVVVVGTDEPDWLVAGAQHLFARGLVHAAGAGALVLARAASDADPGVALERVTDAFSYTRHVPRAAALRGMRAQLPCGTAAEWLVLSGRGHPRCDAAERETWQSWPGPVVTPQSVVGVAFNAGSAWQAVVACDAIRRGVAPAAVVSVAGVNQQAVGARFVAVGGVGPPAADGG